MILWPIIVAIAIVLLTADFLAKLLGVPSSAGRFATIDGLRGYLAFGVFICHGSVWYSFVRTGIWANPPSRVYTNLGQASVVLFFMITGFLFWTKLLQGRFEPINWYHLFLSRFFRLVPLYVFAVLFLVFTVAVLTGFHLRESAYTLSKNVLKWGSFTVLGAPDLNGVGDTPLINAGVIWTLRYEWLFYFLLPVLATLVGALTPRFLVAGSVLVVSWMCYRVRPELIYLATFVGGIVAATLVHQDLKIIHQLLRSRTASVVAAASWTLAVLLFPSAYAILPILLLSIAFTIIAGGNTLWGILAWSASRFLGQLTYSIYLLHGFILFWVFRFAVHYLRTASFSMITHWLIVWSCIPVVLVVCYATFRWIELPGMRCTSRIVRRPANPSVSRIVNPPTS